MNAKYFGVALKWLLLAAAIAALGVWAISHVLGNNAAKVRQAQTDRATAEAMQEAGSAAVETVIAQSKREVALQDLVIEASKEIDNAPDQATARAATLSAACSLQLYRDDPACAVRPTDSP